MECDGTSVVVRRNLPSLQHLGVFGVFGVFALSVCLRVGLPCLVRTGEGDHLLAEHLGLIRPVALAQRRL